MTKEERAAKWDGEFIPCKNHPEKRCMRSIYINPRKRARRCARCNRRRKDGTLRPATKRYVSSRGLEITRLYKRTEKGRAAQKKYKHEHDLGHDSQRNWQRRSKYRNEKIKETHL